MNGARALPSVKTIRSPNRTSMITIGRSHQRFLVFMKSHSSFNMENLLKKSDKNFICVIPPYQNRFTLGPDMNGAMKRAAMNSKRIPSRMNAIIINADHQRLNTFTQPFLSPNPALYGRAGFTQPFPKEGLGSSFI